MDILVTFPDPFDRATFEALPEHRFHFLEGPTSHWRPTPGFDVLDYLERCRDYAREHRIEAVLSTHDLGDLVAALVAADLGLPGPSPEAVFLCLHKYYARRAEPDPIRCEALRLGEAQAPTTRSTPFGYPCFLKAPWLKLGLLGFQLNGPEDLERALAVARREYPGWARQYRPLFERYVDRERYPLAAEDILLVEELVEGPQVTVDGWVSHDGEIHLWAITDTNFYPGTRVIDNFSLPSRHPREVQEQLWRKAEEAIRAIGFRGGFWNAELWVKPEGPRIVEVNGRSAACFAVLYQGCLDASVFAAAVELACGNDPGPEPVWNGTVGGQFNLITFAEGRVADLLDVDAAREVRGLSPTYAPDEVVRPASEFGVLLAQVELFGPSYEAIREEAEAIRRRLLKRPEHSPW
jgi:hypothetical protein